MPKKAKLNANDSSVANDVSQLRKTYSLIGLFNEDANAVIEAYERANPKEQAPAQVVALAEQRLEARKNKDWAKSDELRTKLASLGYEVKDSKDGYELIKK